MMTSSRAALATGLCTALVALQIAPLAAQTKPAPPAAPAKFVAPVKGDAAVEVMTATKVDQKSNEVVTVVKVKNTSTGAIAGLKVEEYWWDKASNPVTGNSDRLRKPLLPGEIATFELKTPKDPKMFRNTYTFSHANGTIKKPKAVKKL
jgi:hypothetical protein